MQLGYIKDCNNGKGQIMIGKVIKVVVAACLGNLMSFETRADVRTLDEAHRFFAAGEKPCGGTLAEAKNYRNMNCEDFSVIDDLVTWGICSYIADSECCRRSIGVGFWYTGTLTPEKAEIMLEEYLGNLAVEIKSPELSFMIKTEGDDEEREAIREAKVKKVKELIENFSAQHQSFTYLYNDSVFSETRHYAPVVVLKKVETDLTSLREAVISVGTSGAE
jgi:hypothetical protein